MQLKEIKDIEIGEYLYSFSSFEDIDINKGFKLVISKVIEKHGSYLLLTTTEYHIFFRGAFIDIKYYSDYLTYFSTPLDDVYISDYKLYCNIDDLVSQLIDFYTLHGDPNVDWKGRIFSIRVVLLYIIESKILFDEQLSELKSMYVSGIKELEDGIKRFQKEIKERGTNE